MLKEKYLAIVPDFVLLKKSMIKVCKTEVLNSRRIPNVKISRLRDGERFHEFLLTRDEVPYCHDMGKMYKITKQIINEKNLDVKNFSSETAPKISGQKLDKIIADILKNN